jgi:hypothetical protein
MAVYVVGLYDNIRRARGTIRELVRDQFPVESIALVTNADVGEMPTSAGAYATALNQGGTLVVVNAPETSVERVVELMNRRKPAHVSTGGESWWQFGQAVGHLEEVVDAVQNRGRYASDVSALPTGFEEEFQSHYQEHFAEAGFPYEKYVSAYRYGFDLGRSEDYGTIEWPDVVPDAELHWEERNPGTWTEFEPAIRYAWQRGMAEPTLPTA